MKSTQTNKVIHGDSDQILSELIKSGCTVDLILTDPPYNLFKDFGNDSDSLSLPEFINVSRDRIEKCRDLLNDTGSLVWFGIHNYIGFLQVLMYEAGLSYRRMNIWNYQNGFSRSKRVPRAEYEPFLWFSKSDKHWTYNVDDIRVPYKSTDRLKNPVWYTTSKGERKKWEPNPEGAMRGDIWSYPTLSGKSFENERTSHPTQKPESLFRELIKAFCPKNKEGYYEGTILDPFLGSGTTAVCAEKLNAEGHNINWIGIELEERWCQIAEKRINQVKESQQATLL